MRDGPVPDLADAYLAAGARFIQVRSKHASSGAFLALCEDVVERAHDGWCHGHRERPRRHRGLVAADGVHVGQEDLDPASVRRILGGSAIVGISTHTPSRCARRSRLPWTTLRWAPSSARRPRTRDTGRLGIGPR